jgi:hypothetical protein
MGADFVVATLYATRENLAREIERTKKRIGKLKEKDCGFAEDMLGSPLGEDLTLEDLKKGLIDDCDLVFQAMLGNRRDGIYIEIGGYDVLIAGGETWGDDPSDTYSAINRLDQSGVFKFPAAGRHLNSVKRAKNQLASAKEGVASVAGLISTLKAAIRDLSGR